MNGDRMEVDWRWLTP